MKSLTSHQADLQLWQVSDHFEMKSKAIEDKIARIHISEQQKSLKPQEEQRAQDSEKARKYFASLLVQERNGLQWLGQHPAASTRIQNPFPLKIHRGAMFWLSGCGSPLHPKSDKGCSALSYQVL